MSKRNLFSLAFVFLLLGLFSLSVEVPNVHAPYLVITIEADGSISPLSASITTSDNVTYTFTADMNASIMVQRSNIVIDGDGWTLDGLDFEIPGGFNLTSVSNVTIVNVNIERFASYSILLKSASQCVISMNTVSGSEGGIGLFSSKRNTVSNNLITGCSEAVELVSSAENSLLGNNMSASSSGFLLFNSTANLISGNNVTGNNQGIVLTFFSNNNTISGNNITANTNDGIQLYQSSNNTISENEITNNFECIRIIDSSKIQIIGNSLVGNNGGIALGGTNNTLYKNSIQAKYIGIDIYGNYNTISTNNITDCDTGFFFGGDTVHNIVSGNNIENNNFALYFEQASNHSIIANNIANNSYGVYLDWYSFNMRIYHNAFSNNSNQMVSNPDNPNSLDNGIEGNYWSNYLGVDLNRDGIGDTPHVIDAGNTDNYPLMGMFHSCDVWWIYPGFTVTLVSNSTVSNFGVGMDIGHPENRVIMFDATGEIGFGFCRLCISKDLMAPPYTVVIDNGETQVLYYNETVFDNSTHRWIYFAYQHSEHQVIIIPEFPAFLVLPLFMMATLLAALVFGRKQA